MHIERYGIVPTSRRDARNFTLTIFHCTVHCRMCIEGCGHSLKGNSHQKLSVASMIELLLKSFLVYHSPMFEAWKVPKRPLEVSCDVTQRLVAYRNTVGTRTNSFGMCTHTGQHSRLPRMHALFLLDQLYEAYRNRTETVDVTAHLRCTKATLHCIL